MKDIKEIKTDVTLEPFFLDYIRCAEESNDLPDDMPKDVSPEQAENIIRIAYKADIALMNLIDEINDAYEKEYELEEIEDDDEIANVLNEACEYYIEKHSIEKIMTRPLEFINDDNLDLTDLMLDNGINFCEKCNSEKEEYTYDALPENLKIEFKELKDTAEYFLYCPICNECSIISKN